MYTVLEKGGVCSPKGFTASGICAGIKASGNADMALLKSERLPAASPFLPPIR